MPWRLRANCCASSVWHEPQSTFCVIVSQARAREALTPEWHCEHATFAWREAWTSAAFTKSERPSAAFTPFWPWHFRQSASAMPCV